MSRAEAAFSRRSFRVATLLGGGGLLLGFTNRSRAQAPAAPAPGVRKGCWGTKGQPLTFQYVEFPRDPRQLRLDELNIRVILQLDSLQKIRARSDTSTRVWRPRIGQRPKPKRRRRLMQACRQRTRR